MNLELIVSISIFGLGVLGYLIKVLIMQRLDKLEARSLKCLSEEDAKALMSEKIEAVKEDLQDIKVQLNKVLDKLIHG